MRYVTPAKYGVLPPWRITAERFDELLNVLPPGRHQYGVHAESFYLIERLSGNIVMWAMRLGSVREGTPLYFCFQADANMPALSLQVMASIAVEQNKAGTLPASLEAALGEPT